MENNEIIDQGYGNELTLSDSAKEDLHTIAKWTTFLSILGFVALGLSVILSLFIGTFLSMMGAGGEGLPFPPIVLSVAYLIIPVIYFFPILYLYRFSNKAKVALKQENRETLAEAIANLRSHYKFIGILVVIVLSFYVLAFLASLIFGAVGFANMGGL